MHAAMQPLWCTQDALKVSLQYAGVAREEDVGTCDHKLVTIPYYVRT